MLACGFSGKIYLFSFFGEISGQRKKITKDAKQMNISFIRERHGLFKEGTNANVKRCNKSTTRYLVFKNRKSGGKKSIRVRGGECKRMINKQTPEMSIKNQPTVQTKTATNSYFFPF